MSKPIDNLMLDSLSVDEVHRSLQLDQVLDRVLSTICDELGFTFATISLVDEDQQEIQTVAGKNILQGWLRDARHSLDSDDIQADVLRTRKTEVIAGWDPRFDEEIYTTYGHDKLIRVFIPLAQIHSPIGLIEAGFFKKDHQTILPILVNTLESYAAEATVAIQRALLYEQVQRHAGMLTELHKVSRDLQTESHQDNEPHLLQQITKAARDIFEADVVRLYPREQPGLGHRDKLRFTDPISACRVPDQGEIKLPYNPGNIVQMIAENRESYYFADAQDNPLLGRDSHPSLHSFAGVPLESKGELLGVLCINYRTRHQFSKYARQIIGLFAQQAAVVLRRNQLVREQERRKERQRLEDELHDSVKTSARALLLFSEEASAVLETDPHRAREHLHQIRRTAWGIMSDINLVLGNLASENGKQTLSEQVGQELSRLVGERQTRVVVNLDEPYSEYPLRLSRAVLTVMREAVINALEHSRAEQIFVRIGCTDDQLYLMVEDDGQGFEPDKERGQEHRGLTIMRKRLEEIGGRLKITACPGEGTTIRAEVPLKEKVNGTGG